MRRRDVIAGPAGYSSRRRFLAGVASFGLASQAVSATGQRRLGLLIPFRSEDPEARSWVAGFQSALQVSGWAAHNLGFDFRWTGPSPDAMQAAAADLVRSAPEVIFVHGVPMLAATRNATTTIPLVFVQVPDPVESGFVASLARPEGNITGFTNFDLATGGKWLEMLREVTPGMSRVLVLQDAKNPSWLPHYRAMEGAAAGMGLRLHPAQVGDADEIERAVAAFADIGSGGCVALPSPTLSAHRKRLVALVAGRRIPTVYPFRTFTNRGGLMSYGVDTGDLYRRAASYIDRILRGAAITQLPVQQPTKFELAVNLKAAKELGLTIPPSLLTLANEVIE
jgi:putative tryptophan/tyrosine transport system substrate-binding protein